MDNRYSIPKDAIGFTLVSQAEKRKNLVVLSSDVSVSVNIEMFKEAHPTRFFEMGIAEQSTVSAAGGMAAEGLLPVYVALAIFSCGMTFAQTRQVCNAGLNVKIIGTHAGVDDGQDGSGHHANEDLAIFRAIPGMTVLCPSDENETASALRAMLDMQGPAYMRVAREPLPILHKENDPFPIGKAEYLKDTGEQFAILFEGSALTEALGGWELLSQAGFGGKLISMRTIKPLDKEAVLSLAQSVSCMVTVENHSLVGGLYSSVAEALAGEARHAALRGVGFSDVFTESGAAADIKKKYGLSKHAVFEAVKAALGR